MDCKVTQNETNNQINQNQKHISKITNWQNSQNEANNQTDQNQKKFVQKKSVNISEENLSFLKLFWKAIYDNLSHQILKYSYIYSDLYEVKNADIYNDLNDIQKKGFKEYIKDILLANYVFKKSLKDMELEVVNQQLEKNLLII